MHGWALATFVKGMKIRLRKNWLSILAKRKIPQSRNCLWCDELMIIMIDMGCVVYDMVFAIKSVWMSDHALHFVIRRGIWGWQGGNFPLSIWFFGFWLFFVWLVSSVTYGDDDNTLPSGGAMGGGGGGKGGKMPAPPPTLWLLFQCLFVFWVVSSAVGHGHDSTPTPLWFFGGENVSEPPPPPPPPVERLFQGWRKILWLAQQ